MRDVGIVFRSPSRMTALPFADFHHALQVIGFVESRDGKIFTNRVVSEFVGLSGDVDRV